MNPPLDSTSARSGVIALEKPVSAVIEPMIDLFQEGQGPHHTRFPILFGPAENRDAIADFLKGFFKPRNPFRRQTSFALGWYVDEDLSGYLLYRLSQSNNVFYGEARWTCFIEDVVVAKSAQGQGGASAMMATLIAILEPLENCAVSGTVWRGNEASTKLFTKHGFEPLSTSYYRVSK